MTEQEMKSRMKEIDRERDNLRKEREEYESYFLNKKKEEALNYRKTFIGKCYITRYLPTNSESHVKAFKIIDVLDRPNERYAECMALVNGIRSSCWNEYGIQTMTLGLWTPSQHCLMSRPDDPKLIDCYKEISHEEFDKMYEEYKQHLDDRAH